MKKKALKSKKIILRGCIALSLFLMNFQVASATDLQSSKLNTGTQALQKDASIVLLALIPVLAGVFGAYQFSKLQHAVDDDGDVKSIKRRIKQIIIGGIGAETISGLFAIIVHYYT